ncbi:MAG: c-type cytochrome [Pirellulaceae bacterium]
MLLLAGAIGVCAVVLGQRQEGPRSDTTITGHPTQPGQDDKPINGAQPSRAQDPPAGNRDRIAIPANLVGYETLGGSPERGRRVLLHRLSCLDCHSIVPGEQTGFPNLSDVGARLSEFQIVASILEPSRDIAGGKSITLVTDSGRVLQGVEVAVTDEVVVLMDDDGERSVPRDRIEQLTVAKSDMPTGQADGLTSQEFADLIAFLSSLGRHEAVAGR